MSEELKIAIEAAKIGAKKALEYYDQPIKFDKKEDNTISSIADRETEEATRSFLATQDRNVSILGEEDGGDLSSKTFWCVLISFRAENKPVLGVSYFPVLNSLYYAEIGKGAYLNEKQIHVSEINSIGDSLMAYGNIKRFKNREALLRVCDRVGSIRSPDPTYCECLIAEGKMEIIIEEFAHIWDTSPFEVILPEAGGKITDLDGKKLGNVMQGFIATNGILHDEVVGLYNEK